MNLSEALELYLTRPNLAANTRASYRHQIYHLILFIGDLAIEDVVQADLMRYIAFKRGEGKTSRTLNLITTVIKTIFGWLTANEYLVKNPAKALDRVREEPIPDEDRAISMNEWQRLKTYAKRTSPRDYAILAFLMDSACRVSAIASLRIDKLDLVQMKAVVYEPKIGRWVDVGFGRATAEALREWLRLRPAVEHQFVFTGEDLPHDALRSESVRTMMKRLCKKLGMRMRGPHSLRHAALQHLAKQPDVNPLDVQTKANHLSMRTTLTNYFPTKSERVFELSQKYSLVDDEPTPEIPPLRIVPKTRKAE